jgi:hypothetical protein
MGNLDEASWRSMTTTVATLASRMRGICISTLKKSVSRHNDSLSPSWRSVSVY